MLKTRILVAAALIPIALTFIYLGGWFLAVSVAAAGVIAAFEYAGVFQRGGYTPSPILIAAGCVVLALTRYVWGFANADLYITLLTFLVMAFYLVRFEHGSEKAATDFAITLAGVLYIGWLGAYFISLRQHPAEGLGWLLASLLAIWAADSFAYLVGVRFGRHKMAPRLSPKKSWEGFAGGAFFAMLLTTLWGLGWQRLVDPATAITPLRGALLGAVLGVLPVLGDLGESMFKRQFGVKDSGNVLPGHGGVLDRIDSWLWAMALAYYLVQCWR